MWPWKARWWPWGPKAARTTGQQAEDAAADFLRRKRYTIVARNVRAGRNEIDIIARDGAVLVFVEVRGRTADDGIAPEDSIGPVKQRHVRQASKIYLAGLKGLVPACRIDVVAVLLLPGEPPRITHYENAF